MKNRWLWLLYACIFAFLAGMVAGCVKYRTPSVAVYAPRAANTLMFLYDNIQEIEFAFCNYGYVENDTLKVERAELAFILRAAPDSVSARCDPEAIGFGHSHRKVHGKGGCGFSDIDVRNFARSVYNFAFVICFSENPNAPYGFLTITRESALKYLKKEELCLRRDPACWVSVRDTS